MSHEAPRNQSELDRPLFIHQLDTTLPFPHIITTPIDKPHIPISSIPRKSLSLPQQQECLPYHQSQSVVRSRKVVLPILHPSSPKRNKTKPTQIPHALRITKSRLPTHSFIPWKKLFSCPRERKKRYTNAETAPVREGRWCAVFCRAGRREVRHVHELCVRLLFYVKEKKI